MLRTCATDQRTVVHHVVSLPRCCPVSGNPQPGSRLRVSYTPTAGLVVPVEDLADMVEQYVGGLGGIRAQEEMIQHIAARCAAGVRVPVRARADLQIAPPFGGEQQRMVVSVRAIPKNV
jgi:hypothetical protein